ncbi:hypothetical protein N7452_003910 [Penicillium brevicompactum]|uniref:F-box domain-containing protein n=1 Tax=Penicillium brevicompactum TaxID=5074 RepID=A0A9W9QUG5_PENBR|nr:hypothetical protein N7452_003910 [Penicillium brevicompactum]
MPSLCSPDLQPQEDSKALPEAPKRESLIGLPDELLLCIADFLTQDDIACLSLCNKRLYRAFPLSESFMIRSGISQAPLLQRLERDLPTHITCHLCNILHNYDVSQSFGPKSTFEDVFHFPCSSDWYSREPLRLNVHHFVWRHVFYEFSFLHFQLAMKQLYHGPQYGISTETMSYTQVSLHPPAPTTAQRNFLVSIDAQVCHEHSSLVLRIQQIVFVPKSRRFLLYSNTRYAPWGRTWKRKSEPLGLFVCHHISDHELAGLITQSVNAYRTGNDRETVSPTYLCKQCKVNFCIEVSEHGTDLALVITRWLELEKDLTPNHQIG